MENECRLVLTGILRSSFNSLLYLVLSSQDPVVLFNFLDIEVELSTMSVSRRRSDIFCLLDFTVSSKSIASLRNFELYLAISGLNFFLGRARGSVCGFDTLLAGTLLCFLLGDGDLDDELDLLYLDVFSSPLSSESSLLYALLRCELVLETGGFLSFRGENFLWSWPVDFAERRSLRCCDRGGEELDASELLDESESAEEWESVEESEEDSELLDPSLEFLSIANLLFRSLTRC